MKLCHEVWLLAALLDLVLSLMKEIELGCCHDRLKSTVVLMI